MLKYCDKVSIEKGEKTIGLDIAVQEFFNNPSNVKHLVCSIKDIHLYYIPENKDGSFEDINTNFQQPLTYGGIEYGSWITFPSPKDGEMEFPFSLIICFTKYAYLVIDNEYYTYDVFFSNANTVTVQKKEQFKLVLK
jgi:hypothetical protein